MVVAEDVDVEVQLVDTRIAQLLDEHPPDKRSFEEFLGAQFDAGLAWVQVPEGQGGLGLSPRYQGVVNERLGAAGAPSNFSRNGIGVGMAAPVIQAHGSEEHKQRFLRPLFACEEIWCQLFSEPGAGSDVAGLATRAVRDGDEWVVNGQKVWTTLAHVSRWGLLLTRTDPDVPKHNGMSYFIVDMHGPGVDVRPLRQMTGDAEFNEVYFTDARIPDHQRLGDVGEGWRVAITTLMNERTALGTEAARSGAGDPIGEALRVWRESGRTDAVMRDRLTRLYVESEVVRLTALRAQQMRAAGTPGPEGSTSKLAATELAQRLHEATLDVLGPDGMLYDTYEMTRPADIGSLSPSPARAFLRSVANTIEGGTSEIMRNILGERVLGLPGEPRADKDVPWSQVPR